MDTNFFLDISWQETQLEKVKKDAGFRYTPELNIETTTLDIFDGLSRNSDFYYLIRKHSGIAKRSFHRISIRDDSSRFIQNRYKKISILFLEWSKQVNRIKKYNTRNIPWKKICRLSDVIRNESYSLVKQLREEAEKQNKDDKYSYSINNLYKFIQELVFFEDFSRSIKAQVSNKPYLLLTGEAGIGKTHALCDIFEARYNNGNQPTVVLFAENFIASKDPIEQILKKTGFPGGRRDFFRSLNRAGREKKGRSLLVIDALNETSNPKYWKRHMKLIVEELKQYPNIAFVISIRSGFENQVLTKQIKHFFVSIEHKGFDFREWEAVHKFFKAFEIPLPEIPILLPEFKKPLFLLLFSIAFGKKNKHLEYKSEREIKKIKPVKGHIGATAIFEEFVKHSADTIAKQFNLPKGRTGNQYIIWDTVIEKMAEEMVKKSTFRLSEEIVVEIINKAHPAVDAGSLIAALEKNILITKIPRYSIDTYEVEGYDYRFPFQKFSDHLIARYIYKEYESYLENNKKGFYSARNFFSRRTNIGKFLQDSYNQGIIEALCIETPQRLDGIEFVDLIPRLRNSNMMKHAFIQSIVWRDPTAFKDDIDSVLKYVNEHIITDEDDNNKLLDSLLSVAAIPEHKLNAFFLDSYLSKFSMAERDAWWIPFLYSYYGEKTSIDRIVEWGWSDQQRDHISDKSIYLYGVAITWFLASSDRFLRDKSTKAMVMVFSNRLDVLLQLLQKFDDVNDPYIKERLLAVAYGCILRNKRDSQLAKKIAQWVYSVYFKNQNPPADILLRDHAIGIVKTAIERGYNFKYCRKKITPPFNSTWPKRVPSLRNLEIQRVELQLSSIWHSVMYSAGSLADFGNYVLNSKVGYWSGRLLTDRTKSASEIFRDFKNNLTDRQVHLFNQAFLPFNGLDVSLILNNLDLDDHVPTQQSEVSEESEDDFIESFEASLGKTQKRIFQKEIKPKLHSNGNLWDPLDSFDTDIAQRWLFNRVIKLGWKKELHGDFDEMVNYGSYNRSEQKVERIGKKYQWIALYELLARISDNFKYKRDYLGTQNVSFEGAWHIGIRNIDPSCILKKGLESSNNNVIFTNEVKYDQWNRKLSDEVWLEKQKDLLNPEDIIVRSDQNGVDWLTVRGFFSWEEETPPEDEKYENPKRDVRYNIQSFLIKKRDEQKVMHWIQAADFQISQIPESIEMSNVYIGEYPWAPAFMDYRFGWTKGYWDEKIPAEIIPVESQYHDIDSHLDCSKDSSLFLRLPEKTIFDDIKLEHRYLNGNFYVDRNDLLCFDSGVSNPDEPSQLYFRKDIFLKYLEKEALLLVFVVNGEKGMIGGGVSNKAAKGWTILKGIYNMNSKGLLNGAFNAEYKSPT